MKLFSTIAFVIIIIYFLSIKRVFLENNFDKMKQEYSFQKNFKTYLKIYKRNLLASKA